MPVAVRRQISGAWVAGIVSTVLTLGLTLLALRGVNFPGVDAWNFVDVGLMAGLTLGVYKKRRNCAVLLLVYFVISKTLQITETGKFGGLVVALVFLYFYAQGVRGTFAYHRIAKATRG